MIDIHTHILPMVDDGAKTVEDALDMLVMAYEHGTDEIILTPHYALEYGFNNPNHKIRKLFNDLKYIVEQENIPIKIYLGSEYLYRTAQRFQQQLNDLTTLNDTRYLLTEFYFNADEEEIYDAIENIKQAGFIPVLSHPERFECIQDDPEVALRAKAMGAYLQLNKGSVLGRYGRVVEHTSIKLLNEHAYSFVGSDSHSIERRKPRMHKSYAFVKEEYGKKYADEIFKENPKKLLKNEIV